MLSNKRKLGDIGLERRVRARKFDDSDVEYETKFSFGDLLKAQKALNKESSKEARRSVRGPARQGQPPQSPQTNPRFISVQTIQQARADRDVEQTASPPRKRIGVRGLVFQDQAGRPALRPVGGPVRRGAVPQELCLLDEYRDKEIKALKAEIKKTRDDAKKEDLKRQVKSMEGKRDSQKRKDEERRVLDEHKRKEKELVKQGKQPFYLKKSEQKKQLLTQRFESMSKGQAEKTIVRRRKKIASKDRRELAHMERAADARARGR
ncbi:unnamed protein product [Parascedosporium putredinis]|uniref:rRNA biogenesis protein RRP36 n=1 Tax=Parascedosporium putredinis TaxID=1442378 RepID=A0A9P1M6J5_9PEZI|nr:unnamed protein product [Parascedosporium putredinis]CAI7987417.1 unnamed protein product [Parascedosporium putredinis]